MEQAGYQFRIDLAEARKFAKKSQFISRVRTVTNKAFDLPENQQVKAMPVGRQHIKIPTL